MYPDRPTHADVRLKGPRGSPFGGVREAEICIGCADYWFIFHDFPLN